VYRRVFQVHWILHFEPSLDAFSLRSDFTSSRKILILHAGPVTYLAFTFDVLDRFILKPKSKQIALRLEALLAHDLANKVRIWG